MAMFIWYQCSMSYMISMVQNCLMSGSLINRKNLIGNQPLHPPTAVGGTPSEQKTPLSVCHTTDGPIQVQVQWRPESIAYTTSPMLPSPDPSCAPDARLYGHTTFLLVNQLKQRRAVKYGNVFVHLSLESSLLCLIFSV